jgi:hypothetical protein
MAINLSTTCRTSLAQAIITAVGTGGKLKLYNGTRPSGVSAVSGGNTLLATLSWTGNIGTATSGVLDWDEAGAAQTNSAHVNGTPTFADITTSSDVVVARVDIGGAGNWTFNGTVTNGQNVTLTNLSFTAPNA